MNIIRTHIEELDKALGGGFIAGDGVLLEGPEGSGKTTLAMQILYNHLKHNDGSGVYVTFPLSAREILDKFKRHSWDLNPYMEKGNFRIYDVHSTVNEMEGKLNLSNTEKKAVTFIDYEDYHKYFETITEEVKTFYSNNQGVPSIDVIDDCDYMLKYARTVKEENWEPWQGVMGYYQKKRQELSGHYQGLAFHIFPTSRANELYASGLRQLEPGIVELLKRTNADGTVERYLAIKQMRNAGQFEERQMKFTIRNEGIRFD